MTDTPVAHPSSSEDVSRIQAQLDDIKSALYAVAERVGRASAMMELRSNEVAQAIEYLKTSKPSEASSANAPPQPSGSPQDIERTLDKKLTPLAQLEAETHKKIIAAEETRQAILLQLDRQSKELEKIAGDISALNHSASTSPSPDAVAKTIDEHLQKHAGTTTNALTQDIEQRFTKLAELEAALLTRSQETSASISEIKSIMQNDTAAESAIAVWLAKIASEQDAHAKVQKEVAATVHALQESSTKLASTLEELKTHAAQRSDPELIDILQKLVPAVETAIDQKLATLAQLEAELLKQSQETHAAATKVATSTESQKNQGELVANSVAWISTEVKEIKASVEQQQTKVSEELGKLRSASLDQLADNRAAMDAQTKTINDTVAELKAQVGGSSNRTARDEEHQAFVHETLNTIASAQRAQEAFVHDTLTHIASTQETQNNVLADSLTALLDASTTLQKSIEQTSTQLRSSQGTQAESMTKLSASLSSLSQQIASLSTQVASLQTQMAETQTRLQALPDEATLAKHIEKDIGQKLST